MAERIFRRRCSHNVRAIAVCMLAASAACAGSPWAGSEAEKPVPNVVITLTDATHPGSWPTARAEFGEQRVALCPAQISTAQWSDDLSCDYLVGPLWVPPDFRIVLRGDADEATFDRTADEIRVEGDWSDAHVWYRMDIRQGDPTVDPSRAADVLRVVCDARQTTVLTPVVRASSEGLRVSVEPLDDVAELVFHRVAWEHGTVVGGPVGDGSVPIEPGVALVACLSRPRSSYWDVEFGTFHLVDPHRLWLTSGVDCEKTSTAEGQLAVSDRWLPFPELVDRLERAIGGMAPGDVLRPDGYPDVHGSKLYRWEGLVVREGFRLAVVNVDWDGEMQLEACTESGIVDDFMTVEGAHLSSGLGMHDDDEPSLIMQGEGRAGPKVVRTG